MKKRLLVLVDRQYPCDHAFIEEVMTKEMPKIGYQNILVMRTISRQKRTVIKWNMAEVYLAPGDSYRSISGIIKNISGSLKTYVDIKKIILQKSIDCIFVRNDPIMGFMAIRLCRNFKLPFIFQISHLKEEELLYYSRKGILPHPFLSHFKGYLGKIMRWFIISKSNHILPISNTMLTYFKAKGVPKEKMTALPLGSVKQKETDNTKYAKSLRRNLCLNEKTRLLLYLGTFIRVRKLETMLAAFARTLRQFPDTSLIMLGGDTNPGDTEYLKMEVKKLNIQKNVIFIKKVQRKQVSEYIRGVNIGISPYPETWILKMNSPMKLMEYLSCGIPVIASMTPEQEKIIRESKAGICKNYNVNSFSEGMNKMLRMDVNDLIKIGIRGKQYIDKHRSYSILAGILDKEITKRMDV